MNQYARLILSHLPSGFAWPKDKESAAYAFGAAIAPFIEAIDKKLMDILASFNPAVAKNLSSWERELGIAFDPDKPEELRRSDIQNKYAGVLRYDMDYLKAQIKEIFGGEPAIKELEIRPCGEAVCGEPMEPYWNTFTIEIRGVTLSKNRFYRLKRLGQAHILFIVIEKDKSIPILEKYP